MNNSEKDNKTTAYNKRVGTMAEVTTQLMSCILANYLLAESSVEVVTPITY